MAIEDPMLLAAATAISEQAALLDETQRSDIGTFISGQADALSETQFSDIGQFIIDLFASVLTEAQIAEVRLWLIDWVSPPDYELTSSANIEVDWDNGFVQYLTLDTNTTFTFVNPKAGAKYYLVITQDGVGGRTAAFPPVSGTTPVLSTTAGATDMVELLYSNGTYYCSLSRGY